MPSHENRITELEEKIEKQNIFIEELYGAVKMLSNVVTLNESRISALDITTIKREEMKQPEFFSTYKPYNHSRK